MDQTYICDIERGFRNPGNKKVARLVKMIGVSTAKLTEGVEV